jgi:hypothetical protein
MKRAFQFGLVALLAAETLVVAQNSEVTRILTLVREALGGEARLGAVQTVFIEGTRSRPAADGTSRASDFEMAFGLPDRFVKKEELANLNGMSISRASGFNGDGVIDNVDSPPQMGGGMMLFRAAGSTTRAGETPTPDELEQQRAASLRSSRQEFARLALGMFATSFAAYPIDFAYAGEAESPDGKADVLEVTAADGFTAKMFVDQRTHLPLMLSWMDKEPLVMTAGGGPQTITAGGGGQHVQSAARGASPEDVARIREEMDARVREADARRRIVEHRLFYADYKAFDGVRLPTRVQRMVDGHPIEELELRRVRINGTLDPRLFEIAR